MTNENSLAPIKPFVTEEGIELYATDIETGMSLRGLGRFVGVDSSLISEIVAVLSGKELDLERLKGRPGTVRAIKASEVLKPYLNGSIMVETLATSGVKVVKSEVCAAICEYYAFESKTENETAKFSYRKFAKLGIESWIRKTTGHEQASSLALTPEQMTLLLLETTQRALESESKLRITTEQLLDKERYITKATINAPGLFNILEIAQEVDGCVVIEENKQYWTLIEWVEQYKGITIPEKMYRQLRLKVAGLFESLRHRTPKKESRLNPNGKTVPAYVYSKEDFHYLEAVLTQVIGAYVP